MRLGQMSALELRVRVLLRLERAGEATVLADEALAMAEGMGYLPMVWRIRAAKAQGSAMLGDRQGAAREHKAAAAVIQKLRSTIPDAQLEQTYMSNPLISSIITGAGIRT